jgi:hypothetical protein
MDAKMSAALMKDFSDEQIGHKPVTWCKACTEAVRSGNGKACGNHREISCQKCRTKITSAHNCLDFVGHADVRARLCEADPDWSWEPFEFPGVGAVVVDNGSPVGLWIKLTVGGISRPGYGSVDRGKREAMKELIGDALRNAGLSFGIAWKLWAKGERTSGESEAPEGAHAREANGNGAAAGQASRPSRQEEPPPAVPVTDQEWLTATLTAACTFATEEDGGKLWRETAAKHKAGKCTDDDRESVEMTIRARIEDIRAGAVEGVVVDKVPA